MARKKRKKKIIIDWKKDGEKLNWKEEQQQWWLNKWKWKLRLALTLRIPTTTSERHRRAVSSPFSLTALFFWGQDSQTSSLEFKHNGRRSSIFKAHVPETNSPKVSDIPLPCAFMHLFKNKKLIWPLQEISYLYVQITTPAWGLGQWCLFYNTQSEVSTHVPCRTPKRPRRATVIRLEHVTFWCASTPANRH